MFRNVARRSMVWALLGLLVISATAMAAPPPWTPPGRALGQQAWWGMFDLEQGTTYTYDLRGTNWSRGTIRGELSFTPTYGDSVRFWYDVNGIRGQGTAAADPQALAGAVLLSAVMQAGNTDVETLQLLAAPFYWVNWVDLFYDARFRNGTVWEEFTSPPTRFEAKPTRGAFSTTYEGQIVVGRDTVARLWLDLWEPLPERVVVMDGRWEFSAQLTNASQRPLLR